MIYEGTMCFYSKIIALSFIIFFNFRALADCPKGGYKKGPSIAKSRVYKGLPFHENEFLRLNVKYLGLHVGFLDFEVLEPAKRGQDWLMNLKASVNTGDWYEGVFKARDAGIAYLYPITFTPFQFRMIQDHKPFLGSDYYEDKWVNFQREKCQVREEYERYKGDKKKTKSKTAPLDSDSHDILGALYKLRTIDFVRYADAKIKVYTSEKNWWLKATREEFVKVKVPAGKFDAVRLDLQTYIGKELQQKGKARIWIAFREPGRPFVKIEAEIKVGSFIAEMSSFKAGKAKKAEIKK